MLRRALAVVLALALALAPLPAPAATGTHAPNVAVQYLNNSGDVCNGCLLFTYTVGTTTKKTTYTDVALTSANTNPIVLDSAGRATIFLTPGESYKFVLAPSTDTDPPTSAIWTRDNISAIAPAGSATDTDVSGTAGETLAAGELVYLSDGSGGNTAGRWYKADSDNTYSSTNAAQLGVATVAAAAGAAETVRIAGRATGLSGLVAGTVYYVSATAGALTSTAPTNARAVGIADTTTTLVVGPWVMPAGTSVLGNAITLNGLITPGGTVQGPWAYRPGDSTTADGRTSGRLASSAVDGENSGAAETTVYTYTLPANALDDNYDAIRVTVAGTAANNAATKTVKLHLGSSSVAPPVGMVYTNIHWSVTGLIIRLTSTSQRVIWCTSPDGTTTTNLCSYAAWTETLTGALTLKITLTGTSNADITARMWVVESVG